MTETALPWVYYSGSRSIYGGPAGDISVAILTGPRGEQSRQDANAARILRAVQCEEIVRELAQVSPGWECNFCNQYAGKDYSNEGHAENQIVEKHASDCIWRKAKEIAR